MPERNALEGLGQTESLVAVQARFEEERRREWWTGAKLGCRSAAPLRGADSLGGKDSKAKRRGREARAVWGGTRTGKV